MSDFFKKAKPVWLTGKASEKNITMGLYTTVESNGRDVVLRVATSGFYRVFVNGEFVTFGPARCAHGFFRVDETVLPLTAGINHIAIEAVNYYIKSFASLKQNGFLQLELECDSKVLCASGVDGFESFELTERVRFMQRYSYQRPMGESYRLSGDTYGWRVGRKSPNAVPHGISVGVKRRLVSRNLAPYTFPVTEPQKLLSRGSFITGVIPEKYKKDRSLFGVGKGDLDGWTEDSLELHLSDELQEWQITEMTPCEGDYLGNTHILPYRFETVALPSEKTGFIAMNIVCKQAGTMYICFDETLRPNGDVDPNSMQCMNAIRFDTEVGEYRFQSVEPFGFKFLKLACTSGEFEIKDLRLIELGCPQPVVAEYKGNDLVLAEVFTAAVETFRQNAVDIFMDCPTRERAGWLCDSFFTARTEFALTGDNAVERNFLENFLLPDDFDGLPKGMLPMCYPADHLNGQFIPNWAMWFVLELEDHVRRTGDRDFVLKFRTKVYDLLDYFKRFENSDGLLEKLENWVFVEWSKANDFVQDINFPSNMIYCRMLKAVANVFQDGALAEKAERIAECIRSRSFDGEFFTDNEVYRDGVLVSSGERSETCQYYAFFTGIATPETHPALWQRLLSEFGPKRAEKGLWPNVWPSNAFVGNYLRLELLLRNGLYRQLLDECVGYFSYMAERTGTLWENTYDKASCNHGFASYAAVFILEVEKNLNN